MGESMQKPTLFLMFTAVALMICAAMAGARDINGQVRYYNGECNTGAGINGVRVVLHRPGSIHDTTTTYTNVAFMQSHGLTSPDGIYFFYNVPWSIYDSLEVIPPSGTALANNGQPGWNANPRSIRYSNYNCFLMVVSVTNFSPHTIGFWKHQATVAVTGQGNAQVPAAQLQSYLNLIYNQFNGATYFPISGVSSVNNAPLTPPAMLNTFNLPNGGSAGMVNKAKKQLLALLLNVVSNYVSLDYVVSADDRTAEEAIAFGADMIGPPSEPGVNVAHSAMDYINNGMTVPAGWIPDYGTISYGDREGLTEAPVVFLPESEMLLGNYPNPFNPSTTIGYQLPQAAQVNLRVFDAEGRLVSTLVDGFSDAGWHLVNFDGSNLASGIYLYTLTAGKQTVTGRMVLIK
jgi:hypothetical protein